MHRFSIVIPAYNNKKLLGNTLFALNNQKAYGYDDYEVIVIDDGSDEKLIDFIEPIPKKYQFQYIYLERTSLSCRAAARNKGIHAACGEIIIFIDSDMLVNENYLFEVDRCFKVNKNICLISTRLYSDREIQPFDIENKSVFRTYSFGKSKFNFLEVRHDVLNLISYNANAHKRPWRLVYTCNMAVLKEELVSIGGFDENYKGWGTEDIDIGYRLYQRGVKIVVNSKMEAIHQYHGDIGLLSEWSIKKSVQQSINEEYFNKKFKEVKKEFEKLKDFMQYLFFKEKMLLKDVSKSQKYTIHFRDMDNLENIKIFLQRMSDKGQKSLIYLYDYLENTDLDIWIQLLESKTCVVKYYPLSRMNKNMMVKTFRFMRNISLIGFMIYKSLSPRIFFRGGPG